MKITTLSGNLPHYDKGMGILLSYMQNVFSELGVETAELNLGMIHPPYFDGIKNTHLDGLLTAVREAKGIVLACWAPLFAPSAVMQTFLEYLTLPAYADLLRGKHIALIVVSDTGGEKAALQYLARVVQHMGAFDITHIGLQAAHLENFNENDTVREFVDKELEDFYRALRQNRTRIIPQDFAQGGAGSPAQGAIGLPAQGTPALPTQDKPANNNIETSKHLDAFTEQQEREIEELSRLFAEKYTGPESDAKLDEFIDDGVVLAPLSPPISPKPPIPSRKKTARQLTQSLPHYFQPQLSSGTQAMIQINISGKENFEGYLTILSKECTYTDGAADDPDVTVIADAAIWMDVLNAKLTAQKAFMIGGLKVRGALALFTKFDTLFKLG